MSLCFTIHPRELVFKSLGASVSCYVLFQDVKKNWLPSMPELGVAPALIPISLEHLCAIYRYHCCMMRIPYSALRSIEVSVWAKKNGGGDSRRLYTATR